MGDKPPLDEEEEEDGEDGEEIERARGGGVEGVGLRETPMTTSTRARTVVGGDVVANGDVEKKQD